MNIKQKLTKLLTNTCIFFSAMILVYAAIVALINTEASEILISGVRMMFFFIFSLLFSLASLIYSIKTISTPVRIISHYFITLLACYVCLFLPAELTPATTLVGIVLYTVLYAVLAAIFAFVSSLIRKNANKKEEYTSKFSK